ncbi:hypothetical protein [Trinickia sp.]|jgi:hypothetical protein
MIEHGAALRAEPLFASVGRAAQRPAAIVVFSVFAHEAKSLE